MVLIYTEVNKNSAGESDGRRLRVQCVRLSRAVIYHSIKISCLTTELYVECQADLVKTHFRKHAKPVAAPVMQEAFVQCNPKQKFVDVSLSVIAIVQFNSYVLTL